MNVPRASGMAWEYVLASGLACLLITRYQVLQYGQSQYVRQFGMNPLTNDLKLLELEGRIIKAPTLKYNPGSKRPNMVCTAYLSSTSPRWVDVSHTTKQPTNGTWNMWASSSLLALYYVVMVP